MIHKLQTALNKRLSPLLVIVTLLSIAWLFYYPVISADILFQDDTNRALISSGHHDFSVNGRFSNELLSRLMSGLDTSPVDYGNLGQILGVLSVVTSVFMLLRLRLDFSIRSVAAVSPLIINPFLLHNISYQYDSFGMLLGYSLAILAFTLFKDTKKRFLLSTLLLFISFGFYQAMPTVFLMVIALEFIINVSRANKSLSGNIKTLTLQGVLYAVGLVAYVLTTKYIFALTTERNAIKLTALDIPDNVRRLLSLLLDYFQGPLLAVLILSILVSVVAILMHVRAKNSKLLRSCMILTGLILLSATLLGPMVLTKDALIYPRSVPTFALFGLVPGVALVILGSTYKATQAILLALLSASLLQSVIFSHTYGSFLKNQADHRELVVTSIYTFIQSSEINGRVYITGNSGSPISARKATGHYPVLHKFWNGEPNSATSNPVWVRRLLRDQNVAVAVDWKKDYPNYRPLACGLGSPEPATSNNVFSAHKIGADEKGDNTYLIFLKNSPDEGYCES